MPTSFCSLYFFLLFAITGNSQLNLQGIRDAGIEDLQDYIVIFYDNDLCSKIDKVTGLEEIIYDLTFDSGNTPIPANYIVEKPIRQLNQILVKRISDKSRFLYNLESNIYQQVFNSEELQEFEKLDEYWTPSFNGDYLLSSKNDTLNYINISTRNFGRIALINSDIDEGLAVDLNLNKNEITFLEYGNSQRSYFKYNFAKNELTDFIYETMVTSFGGNYSFLTNYIDNEATQLNVYESSNNVITEYPLGDLKSIYNQYHTLDGKIPFFTIEHIIYAWDEVNHKFEILPVKSLGIAAPSFIHSNEIYYNSKALEITLYDLKEKKEVKRIIIGKPINIKN